MKKLLFSLLILPACTLSFGQNTFVPDNHFEQALIDLGLDDVLNDSVATGNIDTLSYLHISWKDIDDLTGIEDFSSLAFLHVGSNNLSSLDVSQNSQLVTLNCELNELTSLTLGSNPHLKSLFCRANLLTNIDLSGLPALYTLSTENNLLTQLNVTHNPLLDYLNVQGNLLWNLNTGSNPMLEGLNCSETPITALDLSQNPQLNTLHCITTQLTELDLSQNPALIFLLCNDIPNLEVLNLKNGNNLELLTFEALGNPNLFCIEVDTPIYSQLNWNSVDSWVSFQENCTLGIDGHKGSTVNLSPNPAADQIHFSDQLGEITIRDALGRVIQSVQESVAEISVSALPEGVYSLHGTSHNGEQVSLRFIRQNP
jgi:hypothetical protein